MPVHSQVPVLPQPLTQKPPGWREGRGSGLEPRASCSTQPCSETPAGGRQSGLCAGAGASLLLLRLSFNKNNLMNHPGASCQAVGARERPGPAVTVMGLEALSSVSPGLRETGAHSLRLLVSAQGKMGMMSEFCDDLRQRCSSLRRNKPKDKSHGSPSPKGPHLRNAAHYSTGGRRTLKEPQLERELQMGRCRSIQTGQRDSVVPRKVTWPQAESQDHQ